MDTFFFSPGKKGSFSKAPPKGAPRGAPLAAATALPGRGRAPPRRQSQRAPPPSFAGGRRRRVLEQTGPSRGEAGLLQARHTPSLLPLLTPRKNRLAAPESKRALLTRRSKRRSASAPSWRLLYAGCLTKRAGRLYLNLAQEQEEERIRSELAAQGAKLPPKARSHPGGRMDGWMVFLGKYGVSPFLTRPRRNFFFARERLPRALVIMRRGR